MHTAKSLVLVGVILAALTGCASGSKSTASTRATNANCPMSGKPVDGTHTVSYKDQTVGFCCGNCPNSWAKLSDAEKDAKLASAKK